MSTSKTKLDAGLVRELAAILREADLGEVEVEHEGLRIRVSKATSMAPAAPAIVQAAPMAAPAPAVTTGSSSKLLTYGNGDTIELTTAYLTLSEMELRTDCTAHPFARLLDSREARIRVENTLHCAPGDAVLLGLPERSYLGLVFRLYGFPLVSGLLAGAGAFGLAASLGEEIATSGGQLIEALLLSAGPVDDDVTDLASASQTEVNPL